MQTHAPFSLDLLRAVAPRFGRTPATVLAAFLEDFDGWQTADPEKVLAVAAEALGYSTDWVSSPDMSAHLLFIDTGDTYGRTLCHTDEDGYFIGNWGDWIHRVEEAYAADTGLTRCPNCGEWGQWPAPHGPCPMDYCRYEN